MSYNKGERVSALGTKLWLGDWRDGSALGEEVLRAPQLLRPGKHVM